MRRIMTGLGLAMGLFLSVGCCHTCDVCDDCWGCGWGCNHYGVSSYSNCNGCCADNAQPKATYNVATPVHSTSKVR